jgi:hypothetical protein
MARKKTARGATPRKPRGLRPQATPGASPWHRRHKWVVITAVALLAVAGTMLYALPGIRSLLLPAPASFQHAGADGAKHVGTKACAGCHGREYDAWRGSHHARAMQEATSESVLGNFAQTTFRYAGITSQFSRRDGKFFVRTDGPDGELADFVVKYTFGVTPLQQYLIEFPDGRLQALPIAWDTRPQSKGGATLVPSLSQRGDYLHGRAALDTAGAKLELHVRRLSFHRLAKELRRGDRQIQNPLGRNQRRLRRMPRPRLAASCLGESEERRCVI